MLCRIILIAVSAVAFAQPAKQDWKTILSTVPSTPAANVTAAEVEVVAEGLRGATPFLGGGDPSQVEKNREMVRRAAGYLAGVELVAHDPELRYALAQAYRSLGDAQRAGSARFPSDRDAALGNYNKSGGLFLGLKRSGKGGRNTVSELEILGSQMALLGAVLPFSPVATSPQPLKFDPIPSPLSPIPPELPKNIRGSAQWSALTQRYEGAAVRAKSAWELADRLRRDLNAAGNALHPELANALSKMVLYFDAACEGFSRGDERGAMEELQKAEYQTNKVMKSFGR